MHVLISWDIKAEGSCWDEINKELKDCLKDHSWVKPLSTLYIVRIENASDREAVRESLKNICRAHLKEINLVVSPTMQGGAYSGWLPKSLWPSIRDLVED